MKLKKKTLVLLCIISIFFTISCVNSNSIKTEEVFFEKPPPDDYALLRTQNSTPQRIAEDFSGKVIVLYETDFVARITDLDNPKGFQYKGQTPCIVELYADWCKPCGYLSELLRDIAPDYQGKVIFYKLNIDKARDVVTAFKVSDIPKILYFKPHSEIISTVGYLNEKELKNAIDKYLLNP